MRDAASGGVVTVGIVAGEASGDALAAELTRFLREREKDDGQPEGPTEQP